MKENRDIIRAAESLNKKFTDKTAEEVLSFFLSEYGDKIALSSSMGAEDQVLTHMIANIRPQTRIFTLDTGRLFPETYDLIERTSKKYKLPIEIIFPDKKEVEEMVKEKGINLFRESVENRKLCCSVRKTRPSKKALETLDVWICGLRKDQSLERFYTKMVSWDEANGLIKINPLLNWSSKDVWDYIRKHDIPYNSLHDKGFPSIGCQPCTRAVEKGADPRSGRWWWENEEHKECGLHVRG